MTAAEELLTIIVKLREKKLEVLKRIFTRGPATIGKDALDMIEAQVIEADIEHVQACLDLERETNRK